MPGAFLIEPEMFSARIDEKESKALATRRLAAIRRARRVVTFQATVLDLAPGTVFTITGHPRMDLDKRRLLAVRTPKSLPEQKTQSTWKSESTPGGGGWNEITFEDEKGRELVYMRAERDLERLVRQDESVTIGGSIETQIGASESRTVTADQTLAVGGSRSSHVEVNETISVGSSYRLALGDGSTGVAITSDKRIVLTTGEASIVLDGPNIYFDGQASVRLSAGELVSLAGGEVHVDGKPNVYLNSTSAAPPGVLDLDQAMSRPGLVAEPAVHARRGAAHPAPRDAGGAPGRGAGRHRPPRLHRGAAQGRPREDRARPRADRGRGEGPHRARRGDDQGQAR